ncbi:tyramine beta-hydroxylase-like [Littorina saxatilis]|uniref:tyramine beta-hydroxylase-like n=1 Tax=Littorina saxatilis TaxID=31220 RepID=UPI0038B63E4E
MGICCTLSLLLAVSALTSGFSNYRDRLPNGRAVPHPCKPNYLWHGVGHENALGGGVKNAFGLDFLRLGATWSVELCQLDSDGDGKTNGEELGDSQCTWTPGTLPPRISGITHPGICDPWEDAKCIGHNTWVHCDVSSFQCDALENEEVQNITFRFSPTSVPNTETNYFCMTFDLPDDDVYHLVATQPYIDNEQVMHHVILYGCDSDGATPPSIPTPIPCGMEAVWGCNSMIGLWAVGFAGACLNNKTGFKFGQGHFTRVKMEFHWNNPELKDDYVDSSGMTLYYTKNLRPTSAATLMVGQTFIEIAPLQPSVEVTGACKADCTRTLFTKPLYIIDSNNHMHYLGIKQKVELYRNGSLVTRITNEDAYSFDSPVVNQHDPPIMVLPGDEIRTTCTFNSATRSATTYYGDGTSNEMCFAFLTVYPSDALPITKSCIARQDKDICELYLGGGGGGSQPTCDLTKFSNISDPDISRMWTAAYKDCTPFGACRPGCQQLWDQLKQDSCFQGNDLEALKDAFLQSKEGTYFLAAVSTCWPRTDCPKCQRCPEITNPNANNDNIVGDGGAGSLLPELVSMVTMLAVSLLYNRL